jgi:uncharacterized protein YprB with RNaseH-like and TPR domain
LKDGKTMNRWAESEWEGKIGTITRTERRNEAGSYELIEIRTPRIRYVFPPETLILNNLNLVYGIGAVTAGQLKAAGYQSLTDLLRHPRWQKAAADLMRIIASRDVTRLARYGAADLELLGFFHPEEIRFIDIETLGFFNMYPVFLIGILQFETGQGIIRQFFARNYDEEDAVLAELTDKLRNEGVLISYNGRSFDIPYLKGRLRMYGRDDGFNAFHLDLLSHTRKNYRMILPDCRLTTVEQCLLAEERDGDLPGSEVPDQYQQYLDTGNRSIIEPVLRHNAYDLLTLAKYLGLITSKFDLRSESG